MTAEHRGADPDPQPEDADYVLIESAEQLEELIHAANIDPATQDALEQGQVAQRAVEPLRDVVEPLRECVEPLRQHHQPIYQPSWLERQSLEAGRRHAEEMERQKRHQSIYQPSPYERQLAEERERERRRQEMLGPSRVQREAMEHERRFRKMMEPSEAIRRLREQYDVANKFFESSRGDSASYAGFMSPSTSKPADTPLIPVVMRPITPPPPSRDSWLNRHLVGTEILVHIRNDEDDESVVRRAKVLSLNWTLHVDDDVVGTVELMLNDGETRIVVGTDDLIRE